MSISFYDINDGYISDVPTYHSLNTNTIESDTSIDNLPNIPNNIVNKTMLEKHFKEKYSRLKLAYEERISKLSTTIENTCSILLSDELIKELKNDLTSAGFVPTYISEIINHHLKTENERYVHSIIYKNSMIEIEKQKILEQNEYLKKSIIELKNKLNISKTNELSILPITEKLHHIEDQFKNHLHISEHDYKILQHENENFKLNEQKYLNKIEHLTNQLYQKDQEQMKLMSNLQLKTQDIQFLEKSFEHNARELIMYDGIDKQEQVLKNELKEKLNIITKHNNELVNEIQTLKHQLQNNMHDINKYQKNIKDHEYNDQIQKQKVSLLMKQVEDMLSQETNDSNQAILAVHEKMKVFRIKLNTELHREKVYSQALQEEIRQMKIMKEESYQEQHAIREQNMKLQQQLASEQAKIIFIQTQLDNTNQLLNDMKNKYNESITENKINQQIVIDYERLKKQETYIIEQTAILKSEIAKEQNTKQLQQHTEAYRLHYQNEYNELQMKLRHSYTFGNSNNISSSLLPQHNINDVLKHNSNDDDIISNDNINLQSEISYRNTIQTWIKENYKLKQKHNKEINELENKLNKEYHIVIKELQLKLNEASLNIDKLKNIIKTDKSVIKHQKSMMEYLKINKDQQENLNTNNTNSQSQKQLNVIPLRSSSVNRIPSRTFYSDYHNTPPSKDTVSFKDISTKSKDSIQYHSPTTTSNNIKNEPSYGSKLHQAMKELEDYKEKYQEGEKKIIELNKLLVQSRKDYKLLQSNYNIYQANQFNNQNTMHSNTNNTTGIDTNLDNINHINNNSMQDHISSSINTSYSNNKPSILMNDINNKEYLIKISHLQETNLALENKIKTIYEELYNQQEKLINDNNIYIQLNDELKQQNNILIDKHELVLNDYQDLQRQLQYYKDQLLLLNQENEHIMLYHNTYPNNNDNNNSNNNTDNNIDNNNDNNNNSDNNNSNNNNNIGNNNNNNNTDNNIGNNNSDNNNQSINNTKTYTEDELKNMIQVSTKHLECSIEHQQELEKITKNELIIERNNIIELRKRESKLYNLLIDIEKVYKSKIHELKQDLMSIRSTVNTLIPFMSIQINNTMDDLYMKLRVIFKKIDEKQSQKIHTCRIELSNAHTQEINLLESKFIQQISIQAKLHTQELENMHMNLITKADQALKITSNSSIKDKDDYLNNNNTYSNPTSPSIEDYPSLSYWDEITSDLNALRDVVNNNMNTINDNNKLNYDNDPNKHDNMNDSTTTTINYNNNTNNSNSNTTNSNYVLNTPATKNYISHTSSSSYSKNNIPAYESVLIGLVDALVSEDVIIQSTESLQIIALAKAHQEPSYAAQAASKALLSRHINRFIKTIINKK